MLQIESDEMLHIERQSAINSIVTLMAIYCINVDEIHAASTNLFNYPINEDNSASRNLYRDILED